MKYNSSFAALAAASMVILSLASCEKPILDSTDEPQAVSESSVFSFHLLTPSVTRASSVADFQSVIVCDMSEGQVEQVIVQHPTDADFGSPTVTLSSGVHTLTFMATDGTAEVTGSTVSQSPMGDTFLKSVTIDTRTASGSQRIVLERIVARVTWVGQGSVTLSGVLTQYSLSDALPLSVSSSVTLASGESLYTYIPEGGHLTSGDHQIPVARNIITTVHDRDGSSSTDGSATDGELLVLTNDTAQIYVAKMEITGIKLSEVSNPATRYAAQMQPYRIPTRREAYAFHKFDLPADYCSEARCLAYDRSEDRGFMGATGWGSGDYYTFAWGPSSGALSQAGTKTAYSIKPVRVIPLAAVSQPFSLEADFTWSPDTTKVLQQ